MYHKKRGRMCIITSVGRGLMMKKFMTVCAGALFFMGLLTACGDNDLMKNYTTLAEDFTETLYAEDYDGAMDYINGDMQEYITSDSLTEIVSSTEEKYGAYQKIESVAEVSMSDYLELMDVSDTTSYSDDDYTVVVVTVAFESSEMNIYVMFEDTDRTIVNISVYGQEEASDTEETLSEDTMRTSAKAFLNDVFGGEYEDAFQMMSASLQEEMTESDLDDLVTEATSLYGDFDAVNNILIDGDEATAYVTFADNQINAYVTFDSDGNVSEFYTGTAEN